MRKHFAAAGLYIRMSGLRALAVLAAAVCAEVLLFDRAAAQPNLGLEDIVEKSGIVWVLCAAFILLTVQLCAAGCDRGGRQGYTLARLPLSERGICLWQMGINALYYLIFWLSQALVLTALCAAAVPEGELSSQALFLAAWRSPLLHSLLPMGDLTVWARNGIFLLALGISSAKFGWCQRRRKFGIGLIFTALAVVLSFTRPVGSLDADILATVFIGTVAVSSAWGIFAEEDEDERAIDEMP